MSNQTECPICKANIKWQEAPVEGELIYCDDCGSELEVFNISPTKLEEAPCEAEDWGQ